MLYGEKIQDFGQQRNKTLLIWWIRNYTNSLRNVAKRQQTVLSLSICGILIQVPLIRGINTVRNECEITFTHSMRKLYLEILRLQRLIMPVKNLVILCENVIYQVMKNSFQLCIPQKKDIRLNGQLALSSRVIQSISRNSWFCMVLQELVNPLS